MLSGRASQVLPRAPHSFLDSDLALDSRQDILDKVRCISGIRRLDKAVVRWGCCIQLLHLFFFFFAGSRLRVPWLCWKEFLHVGQGGE